MENQVREISLRHLFWKVMLGWKLWIVCALLFAILLPGVKYAKDAQAYKAAQQPQEDVTQTVTFTKTEQQQIDDVKSLQVLLDKNSQYMQESLLMNIDPYQEHVLELKYYIDSDYTYNYSKDNKQNYTSAITNAYVDYAANGLSQKEIWKDVNTKAEAKYLAELVSATVDSDNTFSVLVKYTDEKSLKSVSEAIQKELKGRYEDIADRIGSHKLVLVSENYQVRTDSDLANSQNAVTGLIKSYRDQISTLTSAMTEDQLKVVDSELAAERENETVDEETVPETVEVSAPVFSKKYVVLGFVMGIFLAALYLVCVAVLSNKLQEAEELVRFYKLRQFGILTQNKGSKGINGFLLRIKYRNQKLLSAEASVQLAISNIELYCKNEGITKLFLTGSEIERVDKNTITQIVEGLSTKGIQTVYGENICYDAAAMREASEAGHVVLVEITDVSIYQEIEKELRMLKDWNVNIAGCVGVE